MTQVLNSNVVLTKVLELLDVRKQAIGRGRGSRQSTSELDAETFGGSTSLQEVRDLTPKKRCHLDQFRRLELSFPFFYSYDRSSGHPEMVGELLLSPGDALSSFSDASP
jgi:hypothetical protein